jgi:hypothetical protein
MPFDFGTQHHVRIQSTAKTPPYFMKGVFLGAMSFGLLFILWLLLSLLGGKGEDTPYAYSFISRPASPSPMSTVTFVWVNEKKKELSVVTFPPELEYRSPSAGSYPMSSMFTAYEHNQVAKKTIQTELSIFLRTRIQDIFVSNNAISSSRLSIGSSALSACTHRGRINPSPKDCFSLLGILASPAYVVRQVEFPRQTLGVKDSVGLQRLDRPGYARWLSDHFSYSFGFDNQTLTVVNASGVPGIAKQASVIFKDLGFSVLSDTDTQELVENGKLFIRDERVADEHLLDLFSSFFNIEREMNAQKVSPFRTQMVFVLGKKQVTFFTP